MRNVLLLILVVLVLPMEAARFDCTLAPPAKSEQTRLVWDYADWLEHGEADRINAKLVALARETSNQLLVIMVDTLCGLPASDLAFDIGRSGASGRRALAMASFCSSSRTGLLDNDPSSSPPAMGWRGPSPTSAPSK